MRSKTIIVVVIVFEFCIVSHHLCFGNSIFIPIYGMNILLNEVGMCVKIMTGCTND